MTVYAVAESVPDIMPCRKCGAVGILRRSSDGDVEWVRCEVCGHEGATRYTTFGAITEWNRCARIDEPTPSQTVSQETAVERFYIDCEFDGHNGPLLSIAIVGDHSDGIHIRTTERAKDEWVAANVEPFMHHHRAPETALVRVGQVGGVIRAFMGNMDGATIIADSPVDITRFCQAITTDADGNWASVDGSLKFEVHDINCYPTDLSGAFQHNAWWDAMALRHKLAAFKKSEVGHG